MSKVIMRKTRCYTEPQSSLAATKRTYLPTNQAATETLRKEVKLLNPYSQVERKIDVKTILNFQRPHSITLISKRHQKLVSEVKLNPFNMMEDQPSQKYKLDKIIGKGLHSVIYRGFISQSSKSVAIKKQIHNQKIKNRQVSILKQFNHCNILMIIDDYYTLQNGERYLCIVTELHRCDLFHHIKQKRKDLSQDMIKRYAYQILKGLQELHRFQIVHRDLKSSNIFISKQQDRAIIGDLGSARQLQIGETVSGDPCPFSYRAPQLLFGPNNYSFCSDMWAFGCILLEMINLSMPFKSRNDLEQMLQIIGLLGTPSFYEILQINGNFDQRQYQALPKMKGKRSIKDVYHLKDNLLCDLLQKIFVFSPSNRISAQKALKHEYFYDVHSKNNWSQSISMSDQSLVMETPQRNANRKDHQTLPTFATFQDECPRLIRDEIKLQSSQILLKRSGMNIPLKASRKKQF